MAVSSLTRLTVPLATNQSASAQGLLMPKLKYRFRANFINFGIDTTIAQGGTFGGNFSYTVNGNNGTANIDSNNDGRNSSQLG